MHSPTKTSLPQGKRNSVLQPHLTAHVLKLTAPSFKFCLENSYSSCKTPGEMPPSSAEPEKNTRVWCTGKARSTMPRAVPIIR